MGKKQIAWAGILSCCCCFSCLAILVAGCALEVPSRPRMDWAKATKEGPVLSKGRSDFSSNAVPLPGGRGIWVLDGAQADATCGHDRPGSLVFRNPDKGSARAWVQIPPYDEVDDYIFPEYEVRFWVKHENVTGEHSKVRVSFGASGMEAKPQTLEQPVMGTADWQEQVFRIRNKELFLQGTLVFEFIGHGTVWVDDVKIEWPRKRPDEMPKGARKAMELNDGWAMKTDPRDEGLKGRWFDPASEASGWVPVEVPKWLPLKKEGGRIIAWERKTVLIPSEMAGRRLFLHFGAVDFDTDVWVNGKHVKTHSGWDDPFVCEITSVATPGKNNLIVVRVDNPMQVPGGIYKPVSLYTVSS